MTPDEVCGPGVATGVMGVMVMAGVVGMVVVMECPRWAPSWRGAGR